MASSLSINGTIRRGQDVRSQHVMACSAIANIVKSSFGPMGLDKMMVDDVGDVTISNDGATILNQLEVQHPAARILVELSHLQDREVGDGTTSVVILAAELLKRCNELVKNHVHPTSIIAGLGIAKKEACKYIATHLAKKVADLGPESILNAAKTSISSKIIGAGDSDFFARLAVDAVTEVKMTNFKGEVKYPVKNINILKAHGKGTRESTLVKGYAMACRRASQAMPRSVKKAKIAFMDIPLKKFRLAMGIQVLVNDPKKLQNIRNKESTLMTDRVAMLLKAGVNVVLTTKSIDDSALKYFVEAGVFAVKLCEKRDLKKIAKITGGEVLISFADLEGNESITEKMLGEAELVEERKVGDGTVIYFKGNKNTKCSTILLRGANDYMLDEIDRSLHDALCVVKRVLESKAVVPGGGCVETALSVHMEHIADTMGGREQLAIGAFAQALLILPKQLAVNGAFDAVDLIARLRVYHNSAQRAGKLDYKWTGLDLTTGKLRNNLNAGVLEPVISKIKMIKFATEAAVTLLRIDDAIKMNPKENPKGPHDDMY